MLFRTLIKRVCNNFLKNDFGNLRRMSRISQTVRSRTSAGLRVPTIWPHKLMASIS
jgi:hypothetical protein